jgi:hypothetical protein
MEIDDMDRQYEYAPSSIRESSQLGSNVTDESLEQPLEAHGPMTLTDAGIEMDESDVQTPNAWSAIWASLEPDSNAIFERSPSDPKARPRSRTVKARTTDAKRSSRW